ncbi:H-X9-DG-CTERM domain-containing protein [Rariglobus hedericola]|uniref:H-X9-DG-CTERM domain-containing protein n=1 Tax=Rariglobus hedericola TaxID=2597822 RepID=UPI0013968F92|nr:H-X9-DG-CTERM domain-containing protein [Rariglobus hedericola]
MENTRRFKAAALTTPSKTVLVGDSSEFFINVSTAWTVDTSHLDGYGNGAPKRHGASANYLFADGHVESLTPEAAIIVAAFRN